MNNDFDILKGKILSKIEEVGNQELLFHTINGEIYQLTHEQYCCEIVIIEDICGDLNDLINTPIIMAEEVINEPNTNINGGYDCNFAYERSYQWTFYKLQTIKGCVTIRWYGSTNSSYSVGVDFNRIK